MKDRQAQSNLQSAARALAENRLGDAERACLDVLSGNSHSAAATHLLGLIRLRNGAAAAGERLLRRSIELEPAREEFHVNLGNLLRRTGRLSEAESAYRDALRLNPADRAARHSLALTLNDLGRRQEAEGECRALIQGDESDAEAWTALGLTLDGQNRLFEAEAAYRRAVHIHPEYGIAHHNLGSVLAREDKAEEALACLSRAEAAGISGFELRFTMGRTLTLLYRLEEAEQAFGQAVALKPHDAEAQLNLARLRFMRGDPEFAGTMAAAAAAAPDNANLQSMLATVLLRAGQFDRAEACLRDAVKRSGQLPQLRYLLSQALRESGNLEAAETEALEAAISTPADSAVVENVVSILLSRGKPDDAMPFIRAQRDREPQGQSWIAYEATAARQLGAARYRELYDYDRLIRIYQLHPPAGWSSMAELNSALVAALQARHPFASHPLDQSLRHGSQTTRNLTEDPDPAIRAILAAFAEPIRRYLSEAGHDAGHPLSARNNGSARLVGSWSVLLHRGGYHVNHIHHQGWISSAYYVSVPDEVQDSALRSGWLKFGEPRFATPGAAVERYVRPAAGQLVLFPSYMWHGTNAILGADTRLTIAFDAVPA